MPPTLTVEGEAPAKAAFVSRTAPVVVKPLFGAQGVGLTLAKTIGELPPGADVGDVYYMQSFIPPNGAEYHEDWRVFVSGGQVISAMSRRSQSWITNVAQGAQPTPHEPDAAMAELALAAAKALGADYAGVDLIQQEDGKLLVLEVNSNPAWRGLQSVTEIDIAARMATDFLAALDKKDT